MLSEGGLGPFTPVAIIPILIAVIVSLLGKLPIVAESIEGLRHYRGHLAVVTQTIPAIDEIYGENTRRALQGNAGAKLYAVISSET